MGTTDKELDDLVKRERYKERERLALNGNILLGTIPVNCEVKRKWGGSKELPQTHILENDLELCWLNHRHENSYYYIFHHDQFLYFIPKQLAKQYLDIDKLNRKIEIERR